MNDGFHQSADAFCVLDGGRHLVATNRAFHALLGRAPDELLGVSFSDFIHPDDRAGMSATIDRLDGWLSAAHVAARWRLADDTFRWLRWTFVRPDGIDRVRAMAEDLSDDVEKLRFFDLSLDMLCIGFGAHFTRVSPAFTSTLGWSQRDLTEKTFIDLIHPDDLAASMAQTAKLTAGHTTIQFENRFKAKDGSYKWIAWTSSPDPQTGKLYSVARDVSRIKDTERRLHEAKEAAEAANRAKSEFLANMSHELRTPLNAVLGYAQILARDSTVTAVQRRRVETILQSGKHLLTLIGDVLDLAKLEARKFSLVAEEFHLGEFLSVIEDMIQVRARSKHLAFTVHHAGALPVAIRCDKTRLRQVLINLLGNAVKFTELGGVTLTVSYNEETLRFEVADTGVGIAADNIERVFQPFFQVQDRPAAVEGTGLGLAISRQLVDLMGGTIGVTSELGTGSTFWVEIAPDVLHNWLPRERDARVITGYEGPTRKILVADDKRENRLILGEFLKPVGFSVVEAGDGEEALAAAAAERPDLILMDLVMPGLDGFEAVRRIRQVPELADVPVVAVSASVLDTQQTLSKKSGCQAFLAKPIEADGLFATLGEMLGLTWEYQDALPTDQAPERVPAVRGDAVASETTGLSQEMLRQIYEAAGIGDVRRVMTLLTTGPSRASDPLVARIYDLADNFRVDAIRALVEPLLDGREP